MANPSPLIRINDVEDLEQVVDRSFAEPVVLFKHSATCPISAWARDEMLQLARGGGYPIYEVVVQIARPLSNAVSELYAIRHESPQVILFYQGRPIYNDSHRRVTARGVKEAALKARAEDGASAAA